MIIQVFTFKYLGRRVFLIAPIHHHFEMKAWSETKIMVRFWILARDPLRDRLRALLPLLPELPRVKVLVYGLARSGVAAAAALEARGDEVVRVDARARERGRPVAARRCRARRQEPGRAGRAAARRRGAATRDSRLVGGRARLPPARAAAVHRRHRHEGQDDDVRAARRDLPRGRSRGRRRRERRPAAERGRGARRRVDRRASSRRSSSRTCTSSRSRSPCC